MVEETYGLSLPRGNGSSVSTNSLLGTGTGLHLGHDHDFGSSEMESLMKD